MKGFGSKWSISLGVSCGKLKLNFDDTWLMSLDDVTIVYWVRQKGCSLLKTLRMLYLPATVLVSPKTDIWKYFLQIQGAVLNHWTNTGLFVLKWLHFPCRIWIWQYKFEFLQFLKKKVWKFLPCLLHLTPRCRVLKERSIYNVYWMRQKVAAY